VDAFIDFNICVKANKVMYSWHQAKKELARLKEDGVPPDPGFHLEAYFCRTCQSWHIGSQANRNKLRSKYRPYDKPSEGSEE
jgi:hypothetical protein